MSTKDTGGPAFPLPITRDPEGGIFDPRGYGADGMTLRDYFAAKAMQALVEARCYPFDQSVGTYAYMAADAMLEERNK